MTKLIITEQQYKMLLDSQKKVVLKEEENSDMNYNNEILMGFAKIIGINLTKHNQIIGDRAIKDSNVLSTIKSTILDPQKREKLLKDLEGKGMVDANNKLFIKSEKIVNNFNKFAEACGMKDKMTMDELLDNIMRK